MGLTWIFISSPWWGNAFSFLSILIIGYAFEPFEYLLIQNAFVPIALMCWVYSLGELTFKKYKYKLIIFYFSICISYLIYLIVSLLINTNLIGSRKGGIFDYSRTLIPMVFSLFLLLNTVILGLVFAYKAIQSKDLRVKWKGKFLFLAIISFVVLATIDMIFVEEEYLILRIIVRLLLITSGLEYYVAFFLPKFLEKRFVEDRG